MRVSATEASRGFSSLLNRVAAGETVEVNRHGETVAVVVPARRSTISGGSLLRLVDSLPRPDGGFADDVRGLADVLAAPGEPWRS